MDARQWEKLATIHEFGSVWVVFTDGCGRLSQLPSEFVEAFVDGHLLNASLVPTPGDPTRIQIIRAGTIDAVVPLQLLQALKCTRKTASS